MSRPVLPRSDLITAICAPQLNNTYCLSSSKIKLMKPTLGFTFAVDLRQAE